MKKILFPAVVLAGIIFSKCESAPEQQTQHDTVEVKHGDAANDSERSVTGEMQDSTIIIEMPLQNSFIQSPLTVKGRARGSWFFEASFPIVVCDSDKNEIASAAAQASDNWMTSEFVPFSATLKFNRPSTTTGWLIFKKANPSGLKEKEASISIPVKFSVKD